MWFRIQFRRSLQYFYFLRFSIFVWLFPLVFALLDMRTTNTLTRAIFVPERIYGYSCVAFFLVCKGFSALITTRTVVANGEERFDAPPPRWIKVFLVSDRARYEIWPVVLAQVPVLLAFLYLVMVGVAEGVPFVLSSEGLFLGAVLALFFCYAINAWYYLAFHCPPKWQTLKVLKLGKNAARTVLFPRWAFGLRPPGSESPAPANDQTLENIQTILRRQTASQCWNRVLRFCGPLFPGYCRDGWVYEAQVFAFISAIAFLALFWILYPLTAPVPNSGVRVALVLLACAWLAVQVVFLSGSGASPFVRRFWKALLCGLSTLFCFAIPVIYASSGQHFPTLASVVLLIIVLGWFLSVVAFFLDRYRVPVLSLILIAAVVPRMSDGYSRNEEHFVSTAPLASANPGEPVVPTPAQIINERMKGDRTRPFIIVTATGGGLHAGAWMARIMEQIDREFSQYDKSEDHSHEGDDFRSHILLMSTVSGGSVGLSYYLRELDPAANGGQPNLKRMVVSAQCSSLEAVGWGLVYYDTRKALLPRGFFTQASSGDGDLESSPLDKDRTWALRKGIERNVYDPYCMKHADDVEGGAASKPFPETEPATSWLKRLWPGDWVNPWKQETLAGLSALSRNPAAGVAVPSPFPAFTMNTTSAEAGERVLLANYRLPDYRIGPVEGAPAESFLDFYRGGDRPDLPIPSAAQLSATFPFVSSAARIPLKYGDHKSEHFIDGGYFDNDGTASVIEFLRYGLTVPLRGDDGTPIEKICAQSNTQRNQKEIDLCDAKAFNSSFGAGGSGIEAGPNTPCPAQSLAASDGRLHVILIEIRNSKDQDSPRDPFPRQAASGGSAVPQGLLSQLGDPLKGFWKAGHDSNTGRDRNGLDLAISALCSKLSVHHIILDDETAPQPRWGIASADDPLSWSLTPRERRQLREASDAWNGLGPCYAESVAAFHDFSEAMARNPLPTRCTGRSPGSASDRDAWLAWARDHAPWAIASK